MLRRLLKMGIVIIFGSLIVVGAFFICLKFFKINKTHLALKLIHSEYDGVVPSKLSGKTVEEIIDKLGDPNSEYLDKDAYQKYLANNYPNNVVVKQENGTLTIKLDEFDAKFEKFLNDFKKTDTFYPKKIVIDLRGTQGGDMDVAVRFVDLFLDKGEIETAKFKDGQKMIDVANPSLWVPTSTIITVLVDHKTTGAAEMVTLDMELYKRAQVIGDQTAGKSSIQEWFELGDDDSAIKLTTGHWFGPGGVSIEGNGVVPDKPFENQKD